jgi:hypothetical protein
VIIAIGEMTLSFSTESGKRGMESETARSAELGMEMSVPDVEQRNEDKAAKACKIDSEEDVEADE